ncbi:MAG: glycosyl hydrolase-related protein, partial [Candidatus Odinarchaeota archaeon]
KAEVSETTILRFFEITGSPTKVTIQTSLPFNNVSIVNLAEQPSNQQKITRLNANSLSSTVSPHQIYSLHLEHSDVP